MIGLERGPGLLGRYYEIDKAMRVKKKALRRMEGFRVQISLI